jgi:hypothetical protein
VRKSLIQRIEDSETTPPEHPAPGDVWSDPEGGSHYYYLPPSGIEFMRPDGSRGTAMWMLLCDACFLKHGDHVHEAMERHAVRIGCDMVWPADLTVTFTRS